MALEIDAWRLSVAERMVIRDTHVHAALAEHVGANPTTFNVLAAGNVLYKTVHGDIGHMAVTVSWTEGDRRHLHNLRIAGEYKAGLNDDQLALIGAMAMNRSTVVRDYTCDMNGLPLPASANVINMPEFNLEQSNFGIAAA